MAGAADRAPSLAKDIHPGFVGLILATSAVLLVTLCRARTHRN
ncbi:hypothetical protein [Streptomyces sp. KM273126]|nr:hypothetical protein [Streptomyces sp. KM273126]